jgi:hypothetical protein
VCINYFSEFHFLLLRAALSYTYKIEKKFYEQYVVINRVQCEHHEWLEQHQTGIQPPATRCGEFPDQCLHRRV